VDIITQVAAASEEQSSTSEQISRSIESITTVTQESAMGIQQIARSAEDLNKLTGNLADLISKFKIDRTQKNYLVNHNYSELKVRSNGKIVS
jgi:methyl-accepting chemotaxis protein